MFKNNNSANNKLDEGSLTAFPMDPAHQQQQNINYNGMQPQQQQQQQQQQQSNVNRNTRKKPYVKITEQPAGKALRFRYECEGRSAGSIPGVNSTPENKTYPSIEIVGYKGRAVVVVSCVTKDMPYRPHPHNLVGKEGCKKGVCTLEINSETMRAMFSNLGIQCVKKKDIEAALKAREEIRVDPFKTGFSHRFQPSSIDLNSVRLCFQVFMESEQKGRFTQPLAPVVSEPIYDKKAMSDLVICRLCSCSASVLGNTQIILLCEKVAKEDIAVRFFEEKNDHIIWEAFGEFQHTDVHKQTAITFKTPRYHTLDITEPVKVFVQLRRPSDGVTSEPLPFEYVPLDSDPAHLRRKRQKTGGDPMQLLLQQQPKHPTEHQEDRPDNISCWNASLSTVKAEPRDPSPHPFAPYRAPPELTPSPQLLSPSNSYSQSHNTPSPYSLTAVSNGPPCNLQLMSSANQFKGRNATNAGEENSNTVGLTTNLQDYNGFGLQHNLQSTTQTPQFQGNFFGGAGVSHWDGKFSNNISSTNPFTMQNLLTSSTTLGCGDDAGGGLHSRWNSVPYHLHPQNQLQQQHLLQQQHQHEPQQHYHQYPHNSTNDAAIADVGASNTVGTGGNNEQHGPTVSNLFSFDSGQLVRINSEEQPMLRLNSEDLQISNLSIST